MRYVTILNGVVDNVVIADDKPPRGVQSDTANIGDLYDGSVFILPTLGSEQIAIQLEDKRKESLIQINHDDNKIYADVIGNKTTEYLDAAIEAKAYKAAGYPVGVDNTYGLVKAWATAKLWTMQQAADDIIAQEAAWKGAAKMIREYRLKAKEDVKRATSIEEIDAAMTTWNGFVVQIRTQLGVG